MNKSEGRAITVADRNKDQVRIHQLEKALEPFAKEANAWSDHISNSYRPGITEPRQKQSCAKAEFSIGDLRRAAKLLSGRG